MKEIIDKLSSYNILNYIIPGAIFSIICDKYLNFHALQNNLVSDIVIFYFVGMIISRLSSLVLEPMLKKVKWIVFADYKDFISASSKDPKIEVLSETNNMYRTFSMLFLLLGILQLVIHFKFLLNLNSTLKHLLLFSGLTVLFLVSYRKQTIYVKNRVTANKK